MIITIFIQRIKLLPDLVFINMHMIKNYGRKLSEDYDGKIPNNITPKKYR